MSDCRRTLASSGGLYAVLSGTNSAPMRVAPSQATYQSAPKPICAPTARALAHARGEQPPREEARRGIDLGVAHGSLRRDDECLRSEFRRGAGDHRAGRGNEIELGRALFHLR
jgi:hypothetical protein